MAYDEEAFIAWLRRNGAAESSLPAFRMGATQIASGVRVWPFDRGHLDAFLADVRAAGAPAVRVSNLEKIAEKLLRFQAERPPDPPPAPTPGRITFSGMAAVAAPAPPVAERADVPSGGAPWAIGASSEVIPAAGAAENAAVATALRSAAQARREVQVVKGPKTGNFWRSRRVALLLAGAVALGLGAVALQSFLQAFRYRSRSVGDNYFSTHLRAEINFPNGWRYLEGGDRRAPFGDVFLPVPGQSDEISTSSFWRGDDPERPDLGLSVVVLPLVGDFASAAKMNDEGLVALGHAGTKAVTEGIALRGGRWSGGSCAVANLHGRGVRCVGRVEMDKVSWTVGVFLLLGDDRAAFAVLRWPKDSADVGAEAERLAGSILLQ